jgi:uncharacterized protein (DUF885 family)
MYFHNNFNCLERKLMNKTKEDLRLEELFRREWEHNFIKSPEFATIMGDNRFNDKLSNLSFEEINLSLNHEKKVLDELNGFNISELNETNKISHQLYLEQTENHIKSHEFKEYLMPLNQMHGIHTFFARLVSMSPFKNENDYENYLSRLKAFPKYIDQVIELMKEGIKVGLSVPKIAMADVPNQISRQLLDDITESSFYTPLKKDIVSENLRQTIYKSIKDNVYEPFKKLENYIKNEYIPNSRDSIGLSDLPNGENYYNFKLKSLTTTNLTAKEIHDIGNNEVERIFSEIKDVMKKTGFNDYEKFLEHLRTNPDFYFKSEEELLMTYRDLCKRIDKELPPFFKTLPRLTYGVEKIPDYQAPSSPTAYYMASDINMTRAGIYFANTCQLETRPKYEIEALSLHEAVPGHHLQLSLALELNDLPEFRKSGRFIGYIEGWGLYAEKLGEEMGFYKDPFYKFGQLSFEIWRACRLVIDTGLHAFGWTRDKAISYLQYYTGKSYDACKVEVDRYIVMPGQATTYKIGEIKILELRKRMNELKGINFDIRDFHDLILKNGALPLNILEDYFNKELKN